MVWILQPLGNPPRCTEVGAGGSPLGETPEVLMGGAEEGLAAEQENDRQI